MARLDAATEAAQSPRVFLSYSRRDATFIARLSEALSARGYLADFDNSTHDPGNVEAGISAEDEWWTRLQQMITLADVFVFVVSPDSAGSRVCDEEIAHARNMGKRIVPVLCRPIDFAKAPPRLAALNVKISFADEARFDASVSELVDAIERDVLWLREATRLAVSAADWHQSARPEHALLHGGEISAAEAWSARRPASAPEVSELVLAYIEASRAGETRRLEKERRSLARQRSLQRWIGGLVLTALVITLAGAGLVVLGQRNLGLSRSQMYALAAQKFYTEEDYVRGLKMSVLAARDNWLSPAVPEAENLLASGALSSSMLADIRTGEDKFLGAWLSSDGRRVLTWGESGAAQLWDAETGAAIGKPMRHPRVQGADGPADAAIFAARVTQGERRLMTLASDGTARLWTLDKQEPVGSTIEHDGLSGGNFSEDASRIVTWGRDGFARVWDEEGAPLAAIPLPHDTEWAGAAFSSDGARLVTWTDNGDARRFEAQVWSVGPDAAAIGPLIVHPWGLGMSWGDDANNTSVGAAFSHDGNRVLAWAHGMASIQPVGGVSSVLLKHEMVIVDEEPWLPSVGARWEPGDKTVTTWGADNMARRWDADSGEQLGAAFPHGSELDGAVLSVDGSTLLSWSSGSAQLWWLGGTPAFSIDIDAERPIRGAQFSPDGNRMLTWSSEGTAQLWNASSGKKAGVAFRQDGAIQGAAFSADGDRVVTWGHGTVRTWRTTGGARIGRVMVHDEGEYVMARATYSHDGQKILSWGSHGTKLWDAATGELVWASGSVTTNDAAFSRDDTRLLTSDSGEGIRVWDLATLKPLAPAIRLEPELRSAALSPDGSRILTATEDQNIQVWNAATGARLDMHATGNTIRYAAYSEDGTRILTRAYDGSGQEWDAVSFARIGEPIQDKDVDRMFAYAGRTWGPRTGGRSNDVFIDLRTGETFGKPRQEEGLVLDVSRDHSRAVTIGSESGAAEIWDLRTGALIGLPLEQPSLRGAEFSPDGTRLLIWGSEDDGTVRQFDVSWTVWRPTRAELAGEICQRRLSGPIVTAFVDDLLDDSPRIPVQDSAGAPIAAGLGRIDAVDVAAAPILRGQEGQDVCGPWTWLSALRTSLPNDLPWRTSGPAAVTESPR